MVGYAKPWHIWYKRKKDRKTWPVNFKENLVTMSNSILKFFLKEAAEMNKIYRTEQFLAH